MKKYHYIFQRKSKLFNVIEAYGFMACRNTLNMWIKCELLQSYMYS